MSAYPAIADAAALQSESKSIASADSGTCFHCGEVNPTRQVWRDVVAGVPRNFCCAGCLAVALTIATAGLENFYASRTRRPSRPVADAADEWAHWDESAAIAGLVRDVGPDRQEASLLLEGLTCGACVWLLETWLARQPGVVQARINYVNRRAYVAWNPAQARLSSVLRAVAAIGYAAHPYDPERSEALARTERRTLLLRMAVALLAMMQVMMFALPGYLSPGSVAPEHMRLLEWAAFVLTLPAIVYSAAPFFRGAWRDVTHLRLGMDVPVVLGLGAAFAASVWTTFTGAGAVYYDSVTMFIALLLTARYGELVARQKAGAAIELIARQRPATAERIAGWPADTATMLIAAAQLVAGETVLVRPGAIVPADGEIVEGHTHVEEALLTGESLPRARGVGDKVLAGSLNRDSPLIVRVHAAGEATRLASVLRLVDRAASERPAVARLADRVAAWFIGSLLLLAVATAIVWWQLDPARALPVTVALLVVSCPCALSLATPAALAAATGALARSGVLLAKGDALETLARVTHVVLDKTGTLTTGRVTLADCATSATTTRDEAIALAAAVSARSEHPLSCALQAAHLKVSGELSFATEASDFLQRAGEGVEAIVNGLRVRVGRPAFVAALSGTMPAHMQQFANDAAQNGPLAALGDEHGFQALFVFADALRPGAARLTAELRRLGITSLILSGDRPRSVAHIALQLGIADARGGLSPDEKRAAIAELQSRGAIVAMMGDGVNDAPALAQAQVSIAVNSATPLAQQTADVVLLSDRIESAALALDEARRTLRVIRQNLGWAMLYNAIAIPAAAFGMVTPLVAAAGMSLSSLVVVANALRLARRPVTDVVEPGADYSAVGAAAQVQA